MAQQQINLGVSPSGQDGDDARTAFTKVNENFTEVYADIGGAQPTNPKLTAIAASVWAANSLQYQTGVDTVENTPFTEFARSILDDADAPAVRDTIGAQAANANLASLAGLALAADQMLLATGANTLAALGTTAYGRSLLALANAAAARTALQLGQVATDNVVPLARGGTGATSIESARSNLGLKTAALADIVGPVSQSVGIPSGAIIERGSNASGEYVRYADGTQICWGTVIGTDINSPVGTGLYASVAVSGNWPIAFAAAPVAMGATSNFGATLASLGARTASGFSDFRAFRYASYTGNFSLGFIAMGRWF